MPPLCRLATVVALVCIAQLTPGSPSAYAADKLTICYVETSSALVPLARLKDFYATEGLDVETRFTPTGVIGMNAMFQGECALSTSADGPMVHFSLERDDFRIVATIAQMNDYVRILAQRDHGIEKPADLRGERVATARFTVGHAFLDSFLLAHGLLPKDVTQVYLAPKDILQAFRTGEADAVSLWEPHVAALLQEFGPRAKLFKAPGLQIAPILLMARRGYLQNHPDTVERVLRALLRAEQFARDEPAGAKRLLARELKTPAHDLDVVWPLHDFRVRLDQTLPFILENAARWQIGLLPAAQRRPPPNYLDFIDADALLAVRPAAVTLIR